MSELDLVVRLKADNTGLVGEVRVTKEELDKLGTSVEKTGRDARTGARGVDAYERSVEKSRKEARRHEDQNRRLASSFGTLRTAVAAVGIGLLVRQFANAADTMTLARSRLRLVTDSEEELAQVERDLFAAAQDTRSAYEGTVELYARVARNAGQLGATQAELLGFTTAVNQAIQVSGASSAEASGGVIQLAQALASGELRGEELRSVMENMPRLAQAIADGLGITIGELRELGQEGQLTAELVFDALLSQADTIQGEFDQLDRTVGAALTQLRNDMLASVGAIDDGTGATEALVLAIDDLREVVVDPAFREGLAAIVSGMAGVISFTSRNIDLLGGLAVGYVGARTAIAGFTTAQLALNVAMRANPIGLVVTALGALVAGGHLLAEALSDEVTPAQRHYNEVMGETGGAADDAAVAIDGLTDSIRDQTIELELAKNANLVAEYERVFLEARRYQLEIERQERNFLERHANRPDGALAVADLADIELASAQQDLDDISAVLTDLEGLIAGSEARIHSLLTTPSPSADAVAPRVTDTGDDETDKIRERSEALAFELAMMDRSADEQAVLNELRRAGSEATIGQFESLDSFLGRLSAEEQELASVTLALHDRTRIVELAAEADERHAETIEDIRERLLNLGPAYQRAVLDANIWRIQALATLDETAEGYEQFAADVERIYDEMLAEAYEEDLQNRRDWSAGVERALRDAADRATDHATAFEDLTTGSLDRAEDAWVSFVTGRKSDLENLGRFIEDWAARYLFRLAIEPGLEAGANFLQDEGADIIGSIIGSIFSGGSSAPVRGKHSGGPVDFGGASRVMSMSHFAAAPRFHSGGQVLGPGEVPIVARAGEFVFTPEQMDGAGGLISALAGIAAQGSSGETRIEIINNTGQAANASAQRSRGPGGEDLLRITLEPLIGDSIARGAGAQAIEDNYVAPKRLTHRD